MRIGCQVSACAFFYAHSMLGFVSAENAMEPSNSRYNIIPIHLGEPYSLCTL